MARRSESCPRLTRKESAPAEAPPPALPLVPARSCTLQDLGPEDRQKVAKLLKQVVDLGQEVQQLKQQRDEQAKAFTQREQDLQETNRQLCKEQQLLKKKLAQVLLVLRASQAKVNALEAAQQAARDAQCCAEVQTDPVASADRAEPLLTAPAVLAATGAANSAPAGAQAAGVDGAASLDSAVLRSSLSGPKGIPSLLHVAPGAHVNITINHAPEASASGPAAAPTQATGSVPASASSAAGGGLDAPGSVGALQQPPAVVTIPTTTGAVASTTVVASSSSTEVALPELPSSCESPSVATSRVSGHQYSMGPGARHGHQVPPRPEMPAAGTVVAVGAAQREGGVAGVLHPPCAAPGQVLCKPGRPRNILVDATMQHFEPVPVHEVVVDSHEAPVASPMIVPPSEEVVAAASSLLGWQAQHGFMAAEEAAQALSVSTTPAQLNNASGARSQLAGRKVLSYDPAIGKSGAFYFVDVADEATGPLGTDAITAGGAAGGRASDSATKRGEAAHAPSGCSSLPSHAGEKLQAVSAAPQAVRHTPDAPLVPPERALHPLALAAPSRGPPGPYGTQAGRPDANPRAEPAVLRARQVRAPHSPCGSELTDSTALPSPFLHAVGLPPGHGCSDTPPGSSMSLSRMAVALEEVARRQRWDLEPPPGVQQQHEPGLVRAGPCAGAGWGSQVGAEPKGYDGGQGGPCGPRNANNVGGWSASGVCPARAHPQSQGVRPHPAALRHASAGSSAGGRGVCDTPQECPTPGDSRSACSSLFTWMEGSDIVERYDESLVDILSQADEELEQQLYRCEDSAVPQRLRQQPQRVHPAAVPPSTRHRVAPLVVSPSGGPPTRTKQQAASTEAFLAANLYEENDVLSVILEQEDD